MRWTELTAALLMLGLSACGQAPSGNGGTPETAIMDKPAVPADEKSEAGQPIPVAAPNAPKIAYTYEYGFRLSAARIPEVQRKQADLCERQGPQFCQILEMQQNGGEGDYASGSLSLAVAAPRARAFGAQLAAIVGQADGSQASSSITGEDLSKQMVDTEARLKARTLLRDRLMEVLATNKGKVSELVEAERSVAQVNEEIDQARAWLTEMQGRVNFSRINVTYTAGAPSGGGFLAPIRSAIGNIGPVLGQVVGFLILAATVLAPFGLLAWGLLWLFRRLKARKPSPKD